MLPRPLIASLRVLGLLAGFFVIGETLMRVERFGAAAFSPREMGTIKRVLMSEFAIEPPRRDVRLVGSWGLMPNTRGWNKGEPFEVNNLGLRGEDTTRHKPEGVRRIAAVGGSLSMAAGVPLAETWTETLERRLNASAWAPGTWEVLNLGVPNTRRCLNRHLERALYFEPDLILWQLGWVGTKEQFAKNFELAEAFAREKRVPVLAFALNEDVHEAGAHEYFELMPELQVTYGREHWIYPSDDHPDGVVHGRYAEAVLERLLERRARIDAWIAEDRAPAPSRFVPPELVPWEDPDRGFWHSYLAERAQGSLEATGERVRRFARRVRRFVSPQG